MRADSNIIAAAKLRNIYASPAIHPVHWETMRQYKARQACRALRYFPIQCWHARCISLP
jgi:hypothetical protein